MDILRKSLAPITTEAWEQINQEAHDIFSSVLSARKFVDIEGPNGFDFGAVSTGRLNMPEKQHKKTEYGINNVLPLVECRSSFTLNLWELDNASRGAEDIKLESLQEAAYDIAEFEERAIYYGLEKAKIRGLKEQTGHNHVTFPEDPHELLNTLSTLVAIFKRHGIEGPFSLVVNENFWEKLCGPIDGYPLQKQVKALLDNGSIILSPFVEEAFLITERGGDFRLTLGSDLSIGYHAHDKDTVELYFTESFTFQIFEPAGIMILEH